jgi:peptidoglycan/xylan/chitin deacetylase (PgdA/CDA1 family)
MVNKQNGQRTIFRIFSRIPFSLPLLRGLTRTKLIIPYYHTVSDEDILHVKHLYKYKTVREFIDDMDFLLKTYAPLSLAQLLTYMKCGRSLPERVLLLTFDDGYREMSDIVAPVLLKKGLDATFFVNSAFIDNKELCYLNQASLIIERFQKSRSSGLQKTLSGLLRSKEIACDNIASGILSIRYQQRDVLAEIAHVLNMDFSEYLLTNEPYLTSRQVNQLINNGFTIGAHSIDHPMYSTLSLEDQLHQTIDSIKCIREMFHLDYGVFAFPFSDQDISREFFVRLSQSGLIDLSFGTAGLIDDSVPNHLQRFSLEKPIDTAKRIITFQHARKLGRLITGNPIVIRE